MPAIALACTLESKAWLANLMQRVPRSGANSSLKPLAKGCKVRRRGCSLAVRHGPVGGRCSRADRANPPCGLPLGSCSAGGSNGRRRRCPWCPRWDAARQSGGALEGEKASERGADIGVHSRVPWSGIVAAWGAGDELVGLGCGSPPRDGFDGAVREPRVELAETRSEVAAASRVDASHRSSSQRVAPGGSAGGGYRRQRVRPGV